MNKKLSIAFVALGILAILFTTVLIDNPVLIARLRGKGWYIIPPIPKPPLEIAKLRGRDILPPPWPIVPFLPA